jgi:hypothetical protein
MRFDYLIVIILKTHLYILVIIIFSYLIEKHSNLKLLFENFKWKKSNEMAEAGADFHAFLYFLFSLAILIYDGYIKDRAPTNFSFIRWLIIMFILSTIFRYTYYIFTGKDPKKLGKRYD